MAAPMPVEAAAGTEDRKRRRRVIVTPSHSRRPVRCSRGQSRWRRPSADASAVAEDAATWYNASVPLLLQGTARRPHCWGKTKFVLVTAAGTGDGGGLEEIAEVMAMAGLISMTEAAAGDRGGGDHGDLGGGF